MIHCDIESNRVYYNGVEITDPFLKSEVTSTAIVIAGIATAGALTLTGVILAGTAVILAGTAVIVGGTLAGVAILSASPVTIPLAVLGLIHLVTHDT